ncbi:MAG: CHAT domain-containing protein [Leptolyngbyaceae cyanobacterium]
MFNRLFGRQPNPPEEPPVDYKALFNQIMDGLAAGWSADQLKACLARQENDQKFVEWLYRYGKREQIEPEVAERLVQWGEIDYGAVGKMAKDVGEQILHPSSNSSDRAGSKPSLDKSEIGSILFDGFPVSSSLEDRAQELIVQSFQQFLINKDYSEAQKIAYAATQLAPEYYPAWQHLGELMNMTQQDQQALQAFNVAISLKPDSDEALHGRGISLDQLGYHEKAIAAFDRILALNSNDHQAYYNKGLSLHNLDRHKEAIFAFNEAIAIQPDKHKAQYQKGLSLHKLGRYEEAIKAYEASIAIKSDKYEAFSGKGNALDKLGRREEAIIAHDASLSIKPDFHIAWYNRGSCIAHNRLQGNDLPVSFFSSELLLQHPELQQRGYSGQLACYQVGLQYVPKETNALGWGLLHRATGQAHYYHDRNNSIQLHKALTEYDQALTTLTAKTYPTEHLEVLQFCIRIHLKLNNNEQVHALYRQALIVFQNLLNQAKSDAQRRRIETQFFDLSHLQVDLLIADSLTTEALLTAERYKNRVLTWILDHWQEQTISPSLDQIHTLLSSQTAIIYWHLSDDTLTTFVFTDSVAVTATTQPSQPLETWLNTWTRDYNDYRTKGKSPSDPLVENRETHPWHINLSNRLNGLKTILGINKLAENLTNIEDLILIPHRDLHRLPLHAFFPENLTTTYLPSAQIGLTLPSTPKSLTPLLNLDDPDTEQPQMPYARLESALIRQLVGNTTHLTDTITTATATEALQSDHSTLHFTGHGEYNHHQPENSALQLSDGILTAKQISTLDLSSYGLICLASCETALTGTETIATEYVGLVSAFLKAGASNVLSTLWQVDEIASTWLIVRFYQALLADQLPAKALHIAQHWLRTVTATDLATWITNLSHTSGLSIGTVDVLNSYAAVTLEDHADSLNQPLYSDPFFWAGFTLTGRG